MAESADAFASAAQLRRSALAGRGQDSAEADQHLLAVVREAYDAAVQSLARFDHIEARVAHAVTRHNDAAELADPRELQRQLLAAQHEIIEVISNANSLCSAKTVDIQGLYGHYQR